MTLTTWLAATHKRPYVGENPPVYMPVKCTGPALTLTKQHTQTSKNRRLYNSDTFIQGPLACQSAGFACGSIASQPDQPQTVTCARTPNITSTILTPNHRSNCVHSGCWLGRCLHDKAPQLTALPVARLQQQTQLPLPLPLLLLQLQPPPLPGPRRCC